MLQLILLVAALTAQDTGDNLALDQETPAVARSRVDTPQQAEPVAVEGSSSSEPSSGESASVPVDTAPSRRNSQLSFNGMGLASWVTAISTAALVLATGVLAFLTWLLASRTSRPQVVASLDVNRWAMNYLDLHVANTGNASAFDIEIEFDPPLPVFSDTKTLEGRPALSTISVLRPGQSLQTSQCQFEAASSERRTVRVSWRRHPKGLRRDHLEYTIDLSGIKNIGRLGEESPEVQIAKELKQMREDWKGVASGSKRVRVDVFASTDREAEARRRDEMRKAAHERDGT